MRVSEETDDTENHNEEIRRSSDGEKKADGGEKGQSRNDRSCNHVSQGPVSRDPVSRDPVSQDPMSRDPVSQALGRRRRIPPPLLP